MFGTMFVYERANIAFVYGSFSSCDYTSYNLHKRFTFTSINLKMQIWQMHTLKMLPEKIHKPESQNIVQL